MSVSLFCCAFLATVAQETAQRAQPVREPRPFLYYDYVEDGELRGGRVAVDPTNPLHVDLGTEQRILLDPVTTLVNNGPTSNRIDIVFVGDGYTSDELDTYAEDVDEVWPTFLAETPLSTYATYFNIHRVDVTSPQSGVDNDPTQGILRTTALDMAYWCGGTQRLLCVNVGKANNHADNAPDVDCVLALANSGTYGGAGYNDLGTLAGHNGAAIEIALHEFGHSFADLADEYDYGGPTTYTGPEPSTANVSIHDEAGIVALSTKWFRWLDVASVGAFQGAMYSQLGIYRPTNNSKMRSLDRPFQQVNSEQFVRHVYQFVHPIDDATPPGRYGLQARFFVDPMDPIGHALDVQWSLDGNPISGATGTIFDAATLGLTVAGGEHTLSVEVVDNTTLVRDPAIRAQRMTDSRSWTLTGERNIAPHADPGRSAVAAPLVLAGSPRPGGTLVIEVPDTAELEPRMAVLVVSAARRGTAADRTIMAAPLVREEGQPLRFEIAVPDDPALAERAFVARALLIQRDGRRSWSAPLQFALER